MATLEEISEKLDRLTAALPAAVSDETMKVRAHGLLSYEDLQERLTIGRTNPRKPCMRTVKELVRKHRRIIRPVELGHTLVGFREPSVEKLLAHLAGEDLAGGRRL